MSKKRFLDIIGWGFSEGKIPTFSIRGISSHYNRFLDIIGWGLYSGQSHIRYEKCSGICNQHVDLLAFDTHTTGLGCSSFSIRGISSHYNPICIAMFIDKLTTK